MIKNLETIIASQDENIAAQDEQIQSLITMFKALKARNSAQEADFDRNEEEKKDNEPYTGLLYFKFN